MNDLDRLCIEHECTKLMTLYCLHLDHPDADGFAGIFTQDALYKPAARPEPVRGRYAIRAWLEAYPRDRLGRHVSTNQVVDVLDEDHARGRSYGVVWREPEPRAGVVSSNVSPRSLVEYFDEFVRTDEGWRISFRYYQLNFMHADEVVRPAPWSPDASDRTKD
ncbi:hypothetical protein GL325_09155 [Aeromicrobium sp. 636]|uniref:Nuclear transport factor 2 family protein n=1 Tax=Aeromicrobium senzhongii TaxID=2663859 RepID=A0A8I0EVQ4_9ACTN|nr:MULTISPECIES: nuclear transport factor 2 family protein [Aeromicrobium]MBC9226488.1 nuclear transport factor 2 family protein [Aeromicrobium senzhongii]MCQ3998592.1 hypothetical protein [Aeromicrobium sp. 636]